MKTVEQILDEMQARCDAASEGPWDYREGLGWCDIHGHPYLHNDGTHISSKFNPATSQKDTYKFIAASRTDLPKLLRAFKVLWEANEFYSEPETYNSQQEEIFYQDKDTTAWTCRWLINEDKGKRAREAKQKIQAILAGDKIDKT